MKRGFSLVEILITLGIIGVVAAITIPTLVQNMAERSNSEKEANTVQKINKAMDLMRADGKLLVQYDSTDAFVDELVKYLRVTTRCKASEIAKCWPTEKVKTSDGEEFSVRKAKKGKNLNIKNNTTDNVGLILNDGTPIILTYNTNAPIISDGDTVTPSKKSLPIGFGKRKDFVYGSSVMAPIDFVMDVNGFRGPNSEEYPKGKLHDIRSYSIARFSKGYTCTTGVIKTSEGDVCILGTNYSPIDCMSSNSASEDYTKYCGTPSGFGSDHWAGAKKACDQIGMTLPNRDKLLAIYNTHAAGLPTTGAYFSANEYESNTRRAHIIGFDTGSSPDTFKSENFGAMCLFD